jgi:CRP/FNR family cyclic AMP-dependent transcriptional regulator
VAATLHDEPEFSEVLIAYLLAPNRRIKEGLVDQLFISGERRFVRLAFFL